MKVVAYREGREARRRNIRTAILSHKRIEGIYFLRPKRLLESENKNQTSNSDLTTYLVFLNWSARVEPLWLLGTQVLEQHEIVAKSAAGNND
jgi:hypothetical protein